MVRHSTTLLPYPPTRPRLPMKNPNIHIGALYTHTHWEQVFLVQRCDNGWVYTTNLTIGKDKSIPLRTFLQYWIRLGDTHE